MKKCMTLFATFALLVAVSGTQASILSPGNANVAVDSISLATITGGTLVADTGFINKVTSSFTANLRTQVYRQSGTDFLDFVFTVENSAESEDAIHRLTMSNFKKSPFADVYFVTGSGTAPTDADRSLSGSTIGFNFDLGSNDILPGSSTTVVIRTNHKGFTSGSFSAIDGNTATVDSFAPAPLPSSVVLFGTGAIGLFGGSSAACGRHGPCWPERSNEL